jgi:hypothetical protein
MFCITRLRKLLANFHLVPEQCPITETAKEHEKSRRYQPARLSSVASQRSRAPSREILENIAEQRTPLPPNPGTAHETHEPAQQQKQQRAARAISQAV